jgi:hypothetical protein
VRDLLEDKIPGSFTQAQFKSDVMKPLKIEELMDRQVENLSGGELQRVKLCVCLGKVGLHIFPLCSSFHRHIRINTLRHHKQIMCFHVVEFVKKWVDETSQCWGRLLQSSRFQNLTVPFRLNYEFYPSFFLRAHDFPYVSDKKLPVCTVGTGLPTVLLFWFLKIYVIFRSKIFLF